MNFQDVETARKNYYSDQKQLSNKRKKIFFVTLTVILCLELVLSLIILQHADTSRIVSLSTSELTIFIIAIVILPLIIINPALALIITGLSNLFFDRKINLAAEYVTYKRAYKAYFIEKQLAKFFTHITYRHHQGLSQEIIDTASLIYPGNTISSNDLVIAKYKKADFMQADVCIKEISKDTDGNTHTTTSFKGRYLIFAFSKKIDCQILICSCGQALSSDATNEMNLVQTESVSFNKHFLVYAKDEFEMFYVLNPKLIEDLEQLDVKHPGQLTFYITNDTLFVGLNDNNDSFEPPEDISQPIDEKTEQAKVDEDMQLIVDIVDSFKLDRK